MRYGDCADASEAPSPKSSPAMSDGEINLPATPVSAIEVRLETGDVDEVALPLSRASCHLVEEPDGPSGNVFVLGFGLVAIVIVLKLLGVWPSGMQN